MDNEGNISLSNRPLHMLIQDLDNDGISTDIPRDMTYTSTEPFYYDLLNCHDNRMRRQQNSIHDKRDGKRQLLALVGMRAILTKLLNRHRYRNHFVFSLTDLHQSNIFVDKD